MDTIYISIEKNVEVFEKYKELWGNRGITGVRADTMTEAIETAAAIEKSKNQYLYFIDIVEDDINFIPQLAILDEVTDAPILIATSNYNEDKHHEALNNGADFYAPYCDEPEKNILGVITAINSYHRAKEHKASPNIIAHGGIIISLSRRTVFVTDISVDLTRQEFDILCFLMKNRGNVLTYKTIYRRIWGKEYEDSEREALRNAIKRLRQKININPNGSDYIENVLDVGYRFPLDFNK